MRNNTKFGTMFRGLTMAAGLTVGLFAGQAGADTTTTAVDFGMTGDNCGPSPVYAGTFDGTSGFIGMEIGNCGDQVDVSVDIGGGATFSFTNVTGWNNSDTDDVNDIRALTGDHFFSNWAGSGPVSFSFDGLDPNDILVVDFADRKGGERALVTFEGVDTMVDGVVGDDGVFTNVGVVTGSSSYSGSFTGPNGDGEGNLSGARFTIISAGKGSGPSGACCFGENCWDIGGNDCVAAGGEFGGEGSVCDASTCAPPELMECCVEGELPSCLDVECANSVCVIDPDCCLLMWDADCAEMAIDICNGCDGTTNIQVAAIDFGMVGANCGGPTPVYSGIFDATGNFQGMEIQDCGQQIDVSYDLGNGASFSFANVTGWNNTDGVPDSSPQALTGDHFFSNWDNSGPVSFSLNGLNPCDTVILEFADRRGGERALVTFAGVDTLIDGVPDGDGSGVFTGVGEVSGSDVYSGSFTGPDGAGEGNLAAAKIVIIPGTDCGSCLGDLNGDDVVNAADLGLLIGEWGCKGTCPGDLNGDGMVSAADLGLLIGYWGPCP